LSVALSLSLITAALFYALIPMGGAFAVRAQWRVFRRRVLECSRKDEIGYGVLKTPGEGFLGDYRFLGTLQAIQGDDVLWVTNGRISLPVHVDQVTGYTLPHSFISEATGGRLSMRESLPDEVPQRFLWNRMFSLPEGTRVLVCGGLWREKGQLLFRSSDSQPLMFLIYDGREDTILLRSLWSGRQPNEYVNSFSPWSVVLGALLLLLEAYLFYRQPLNSLSGRVTVLLGIAPLAVFLPPGVAFFELYRFLWKQGRLYRAERDVIRFPLFHWPDAGNLDECRDTSLGDKGDYGWIRYPTGEEGLKNNPGESLPDLLVLKGKNILSRPCFGFGILRRGGERAFAREESDLAGTVLLPGDPFKLSVRSAVMARRMELLSGAAFTAGILLNLFLLFLALNYFFP